MYTAVECKAVDILVVAERYWLAVLVDRGAAAGIEAAVDTVVEPDPGLEIGYIEDCMAVEPLPDRTDL